MFAKRFLCGIFTYSRLRAVQIENKQYHVSVLLLKKDENAKREVAIRNSFESQPDKTKNSYLEMVQIFTNRDVHRRGHVEFIYSALKHMQQYGVQKDLEVYKALVDVFPKGKMIPQNILQSEFMHYPKQQQCAIDLLEQMEDNGVMPDSEMETILLSVFGKRGHPLRKYWRMMYWMPKFKNLSPWPVPNPPPNDIFELSKMAVLRIISVDVQSNLEIFYTANLDDSIDDTFIVSGQSPKQRELMGELAKNEPVYVEGPFKIWLRNKPVNYFVLKSPTKKNYESNISDDDDVSKINFSRFLGFGLPPKTEIKLIPSVHEQEDGVILSVCATGTSSKDSLLSWVRLLEKNGNENLKNLSVVFSLKAGEKDVAKLDENEGKEEGSLEKTS